MKRRLALFLCFPALSLVLLLGANRQAHEKASWRPVPISRAQFAARWAPLAAPSFPNGNAAPTPQQQRFWQLAGVGGVQLRAISPDNTKLLAQGQYQRAALLDARDGSVSADLFISFDRGWSGGQFSPDGRFLTLTQPALGVRYCFAVADGQSLWSERYAGGRSQFFFSPDGQFCATVFNTNVGASRHQITIRHSATGRVTQDFGVYLGTKKWGFSRDSGFFLVESAPGQFQEIRLR